MDQAPKTGKSIVSKGQYLINTCKKATLSSFGFIVVLFGVLGATITVGNILPMLWHLGWSNILPCLFAIGLLGGGSWVLLYLGREAIKEGIEIDTGIPLTRANTAGLPAAASLVRASEHPLEEQKAILLRAATSGIDTPAEELVRASVGPQNTDGP